MSGTGRSQRPASSQSAASARSESGPPGTCSGRQSVIPLRCLSLGRLPAAAQRSSLVQREALHEDKDPAT